MIQQNKKAKCLKCGLEFDTPMQLLEHFREKHPVGSEFVNVVSGDEEK